MLLRSIFQVQVFISAVCNSKKENGTGIVFVLMTAISPVIKSIGTLAYLSNNKDKITKYLISVLTLSIPSCSSVSEIIYIGMLDLKVVAQNAPIPGQR